MLNGQLVRIFLPMIRLSVFTEGQKIMRCSLLDNLAPKYEQRV